MTMNTNHISPLSKEQWQNLETLATQANAAIDALRIALLFTAKELDNDQELQAKLLSVAKELPASWSGLLPYFYHCQSEWMGNNQAGEPVFKLREPHIANRLPRREVLG